MRRQWDEIAETRKIVGEWHLARIRLLRVPVKPIFATMTKDVYHKLRAQPFQPFVMHVADGRQVEVVHPEFLAHSPDGRTVVGFGQDNSMRILDSPLVTEIHIRPKLRRKAA